VERYVNIIRHHYEIVEFVVPDYAYSAGTIFCMSGDNIHMDYFSVLGPIDPQVQNKDGNWVAALGYLDKVNEAIGKSKNDTISKLEFVMVKDLDLAELRMYEQAKDLTIQLLKKWLVKYKFKDWDKHQTTPALLGKEVTLKEKECRAEEIAKRLNKNDEWNSHGRPINIETLKELRLKIDDYSTNMTLRGLIRDYYDLQADYVQSNNLPIFVQTRKYI
ncbi:MAG TPA: serine dehydrogenasease, partial [Niastella sp.]